MRKYFIHGCVGRGLDLDSRARLAPAPAGTLGFFETCILQECETWDPNKYGIHCLPEIEKWDLDKYGICQNIFVGFKKWDPYIFKKSAFSENVVTITMKSTSKKHMRLL